LLLTIDAILCIFAYVRDSVESFKAVGEPTRYRALRLLVEAKVDLCACEIIDILQKPQYTVSKCLGTLVTAGLVDERREGRMMLYSLAHSPMNDAIFAAIGASPGTDPEEEADSERLARRLSQRVDAAVASGC
jgi:ArsR family transcriptional regulator, arsenate/arsenite/antimonite-responsive transcriptional repressor